ncbi:tRNA epoxyqueuosine(34) reductase QueG [Caldisalinibacter kiritimatiensis]|uniref:Epoxyqueuosine (OQ) reductase QueG n=1 Tax=Caldisalinibacter kiritimatiensis TaxID=1304284 RepID=R1CT77_9FIRM|nr:tRNA epoxyqueuosine(34) reductase QueG [Caldisalinibacter kiritimatiensis]EOC99898.1 Epoxyqueuosine (oQ) reductase QueG [Caldisalinibacter kiritimatiensis]
MNLKDYIIDKAKGIGIDIIGFTDAEPFDEVKEFLIQRKEKGFHTEFEEEDLEKRYNPKLHLPSAKSIIVIGLSYNVDFKLKRDNKLVGRLSKSSWGIDYHKVVKEKIQLLVEEIRKIIDFDYKAFVDTGPLIDRYIAEKSGIGWYGKNCSIINDEFGSFIFLGYILTDLDLQKDNSLKSKCEDCRLCIDACPTNAIQEDYKINATRCVSYLTQTKKRIPYELRDKMGVKIYGCDTCQLVCPKNKNVKKGQIKEFIPHKTSGYLDLLELLKISNKEFKKKYGHISGSWRGKNILKRNAIIALGNIGDKKYLDLIEKQLNDPSPMIREYAAWAILKIDIKRGKELLKQRLQLEKDKEVKEELEKLLKYFKVENKLT